jgi:hypothetical protein
MGHQRTTLSEKSRPLRHHHITDRHMIFFASMTLNAHGWGLIGGSAKLVTTVDRSTNLSQAIDKLLRLRATARSRANAYPTDTSTFPYAYEEDGTADLPTETRPGDKTLEDQTMDMEEDTRPTDRPTSTLLSLPPKKHNGNKSAPLSVTVQKPMTTHLLPTTMSSVSSLYVSRYDPPLPLPDSTSRKNTPHRCLRTPSCFPLMAETCNAMILIPHALSGPNRSSNLHPSAAQTPSLRVHGSVHITRRHLRRIHTSPTPNNCPLRRGRNRITGQAPAPRPKPRREMPTVGRL